jgi:NADPH:quinone reductase-like Zn-dependent oxidoreductase
MEKIMKAIVYETYGAPDVLKLREVPKPVAGDGEVLVKVHATSVTVGDYRARSLILPPGFGPLGRLMFGFFRPRRKILGYEVSGVIEAVGSGVTRFKAGDAIFGTAGFTFGAYAEYMALKETAAIALKPANLTFEQAAALAFGGETALYFLGKAQVKRGDRVLINGASGSVGTAMVQMARHAGAEVTGVCSTGNVEMVRSLGADRVIDYTQADFAKSSQIWDVVADCVGNAQYPRCEPVLADNGRHIAVVADLPSMVVASFRKPKRGIQAFGGGFKETAEDMQELARLAETGAYMPFIDRTYPLEQIVEAHRYVDTGRKRGNVVVTVVQPT